MMDKLSYRQKNKLLIVATGVLLMVVYFAAIKRTILESTINKELTDVIRKGETASPLIQNYRERLSEYKNQLGLFEVDSAHNHAKVLENISNYCQQNRLTIISFPEETIEKQDGFEIHNNVIEVSGNFKQLLNLSHYLEKVNKLGKLISLKLSKGKDKKTKKTILTAVIYLQNTKL